MRRCCSVAVTIRLFVIVLALFASVLNVTSSLRDLLIISIITVISTKKSTSVNEKAYKLFFSNRNMPNFMQNYGKKLENKALCAQSQNYVIT